MSKAAIEDALTESNVTMAEFVYKEPGRIFGG